MQYFNIFSRISIHCKSRNVFTREHQASVFKAAYEELPVHVTTLRTLGNFKAALLGAGCVRKIHGIQKPRSFELKRMGSDAVTVGMKEYMHSPRYSGLTKAGVFESTAPSYFKGGIQTVENAPPFELRTVDSEVIRYIKMRYKAVHSRVDALFPCGALRPTTPNNQSIFSVACSRLSKRTLSESFIKSCTLSEIPVNNYYFTRY